jgi:hypothetical protein
MGKLPNRFFLRAPLRGVLLVWLLCLSVERVAAQSGGSRLATEPGTISVEELLPRPLVLPVGQQEATIYYQSDMQRVLGTMAPGTRVTLVGLSDTAYRVRGRARHGDVSGWMRPQDLVMPAPDTADNLRKLYERQLAVDELIASREVALGMTSEEVKQALGRPSRTRRKQTAFGNEEVLEFATFERVPQVVTGRDGFGNLVQSIVYVRVETGTLSVTLKNGVVEEIEETKGNPLGGGGVKIVVPPLFFR